MDSPSIERVMRVVGELTEIAMEFEKSRAMESGAAIGKESALKQWGASLDKKRSELRALLATHPAIGPEAPKSPEPTNKIGARCDLALLPAQALVTEESLAKSLGVTTRTVRRMVQVYDLPPPIKVGGRSSWFVGRVLEFLNERAEAVARKQDREARRLGIRQP